ncbi:MAG: leucine-rich repeat protein [Clostridia bacterium]|nr:leucine-rich repeat protein [Clostridia bacterium]
MVKKTVSLVLAVSMLASLIFTGGVLSFLKGDVNGNEETDNKDVVYLFRYVSGSEKAGYESAYDINGDGFVDNKDVAELFKFLSSGEQGVSEEPDETVPDEADEPEKCVHSFGEWNIIKEASCTEDGEKQRTCAVCGETETDTIPAEGHDYGEDNICKRCGKEKLIETPDEYFTFTLLEDDTYEIKAKDISNTPENVVIPEEHDGRAVTSIGFNAFAGCVGLESVTMPDCVASICSGAFFSCRNLKSVTICNGVTSIGDRAFFKCVSLESVTVPDSVTSIGEDAFSGCSGLKSVVIPDGVTSMGKCAFSECCGLKDVTIGNNVTEIDDCAFNYCTGITGVTIPAGVTSIGLDAFGGCSGLESVTIPDSVTSIGALAFYGCGNLTNIIYTGTKACWRSISKGEKWNSSAGDYTVYCTDGDLTKEES